MMDWGHGGLQGCNVVAKTNSCARVWGRCFIATQHIQISPINTLLFHAPFFFAMQSCVCRVVLVATFLTLHVELFLLLLSYTRAGQRLKVLIRINGTIFLINRIYLHSRPKIESILTLKPHLFKLCFPSSLFLLLFLESESGRKCT